jgi:hypothetical protein
MGRSRWSAALAIAYLVLTAAIYLPAWLPGFEGYHDGGLWLTFILTLPGSLGAGVIAILLYALGARAVETLTPFILPACGLMNTYFIRTRVGPRLLIRARAGTLWK